MSALNQEETKDLRDIISILEYVQKNGFDPESSSESYKKKLEVARRRLRTILTMKGHYSK